MGEDDLVRRLRAGDEEAFAQVVRRYHVRLVRFATTFVTRAELAEDVTQETWIAMLRGIHGFEGRASLQTWLFQICANRARTAAGAERRFVPVDTTSDSDPTVWPTAQFPDSPESAASADLTADFTPDGAWAAPPVPWRVEGSWGETSLVEAVHRAIAELPAAQRQVVTLRDVEGFQAPEVCAVLEITDANQRVLLHRGRAGVRRSVDRAGFVR